MPEIIVLDEGSFLLDGQKRKTMDNIKFRLSNTREYVDDLLKHSKVIEKIVNLKD